MKRIALLLLLLITIVPCLNAQKKELSQARAFIKSGKNLDKAEKLMRGLLNDSTHRQNIKVHATLCETLRKQYSQVNEKMYLKQATDSATMFGIVKSMFLAHEALDSLDAQPDAKGRVSPVYRARSAAFLDSYRKNLFSGGAYFIRKQQYAKAFDFIDTYLDTYRQPLFSAYHYTVEPEPAYWALYCGYKLHNTDMALKYADAALKDSAHLEYSLQYLAEVYKLRQDTALYERMLHEGFYRFKNSEYFFTNLIDYYNQVKRPDLAMNIIDEAVAQNDSSQLFLFAKCNQLLNMGQYRECIAVSDTLISRDSTFADAYYNAGVAYINLAFEADKGKVDARKRKQIKAFYQQALPYMERFRALAPDEKDKWAAALYNIYLQLNMGKQFEEIDRLLR